MSGLVAATVPISAITQNEQTQNITSNGLKLVDEKFLEWLGEIQK